MNTLEIILTYLSNLVSEKVKAFWHHHLRYKIHLGIEFEITNDKKEENR